MHTPHRIWDLPTRLFHWVLAVSVILLVITAKVGANAMVWHFRLGYLVLALLAFRVVWGLIGGHWSRFGTFLYGPSRLLRYLRGAGDASDHAGHSPTGALAVFALLAVLIAQVASGLLSDDEIAFAGPLTRFVSGSVVGQATWYHKDIGQYVLLALVALHLLAIAYYTVLRKKSLVRAMVSGDKQLPADLKLPQSRDNASSRLLAAVLLAACLGLAWWVSSLAAF